jgi:dipeptidyl aminopeptidase/acylaminoacyl peptidase
MPTLDISPDGTEIAYVDDGSGQFNLVVRGVASEASRRLTRLTDSAVRRVAWHPHGQWLLYLADNKGDENTQLYRLDAHGVAPEALTNSPDSQYATAIGNPFSPDGRLVAYSGNDRTPADQDVLVLDLDSGAVNRIYTGGGRIHAGHWSPDGDRLSVVEWRTTNSDHVVYVVPSHGDPATRLTSLADAATYWLGPWLTDGSGFLVISNTGRELNGLAIMDAQTGALSWLDTPDWDVEEVALSADGHVLIWSVNVDGASQLRARDLITGEDLPVPSLPMGEVSGLTVSADGAFAAFRLSTPTGPPNLASIEFANGDLRYLTRARPTAADSESFVEPSLVRYPSRDGQRVPAYVYRPENLREPIGVVLSVHGGPSWQERPGYLYDGFYQYLLSQGIGVFAPNIRGSLGYGKSYAERIYRDWGGIDVADLEDAVAYLRAQDWVNPARIGVFGGSYGGFAVLSCLSRLPHLDWSAGVDVFGPSNLVTLAKASPPTWRSLVMTMFGDPDDDAEALIARSPVTYADQIRAPLLVIQGVNDPRVPRAESDQIVERLRARGVDVRYELFADEGHGFTKRANAVSALSAAGEFLTAHLTS